MFSQRGIIPIPSKVFILIYQDEEEYTFSTPDSGDEVDLAIITRGDSLVLFDYILKDQPLLVHQDRFLNYSSTRNVFYLSKNLENPVTDIYAGRLNSNNIYNYAIYTNESYLQHQKFEGYVPNMITYANTTENGLNISYDYGEECGNKRGNCPDNKFCVFNYGEYILPTTFYCSSSLLKEGKTGEKGDPGIRGLIGETGEKGENGEKGGNGAQGQSNNQWTTTDAKKFLFLFLVCSLFIIIGFFLLRPYFGYPKFYLLKD